MANKQRIKRIIKQAGIMDMLGGAAGAISDMAPEGLGGLMGAGSAAGLANMGGMGSKGQMIAAAIGATVGAMAASKMKDHEQMQSMGIDANANLGINNALMNLDQEAAMSGMYGGMPMDPNMMGMQDPSMMGGMGMGMGIPGMGPGMGPGQGMMGGSGMEAMFPPSQPVTGYPEAQQAMQGKQASVNHNSANLIKTASAIVDRYFA